VVADNPFVPFTVNTYVRYWDGRAVGYGRIEKVNEDGTYAVRVGGTDITRIVREGEISIHPVHVASGLKMDVWVMFEKVDVTGRWLYHATAVSLLESIVIHKGIVPRSAVDWARLPGGWKGADSNRNSNSPEVDLGEYYGSMTKLTLEIAKKDEMSKSAETMYRKTLMGDPGEFVYATRLAYVAGDYAKDIINVGGKAMCFRFKSTKVWYRDPNQGSALINNMMVLLSDMQVKYIPRKAGDIEALLESDTGWEMCSNDSETWQSAIDLAALEDVG
jgi:hypothetical protein